MTVEMTCEKHMPFKNTRTLTKSCQNPMFVIIIN